MLNIKEFFGKQLALWPEVAERFNGLKNVEVKDVGDYKVQFNPARAVSTTAKVDAADIAARPCFLCSKNRPPQQIALEWEDLEILVNPFPVFPGHLTIAAKEHTPQTLSGRAAQMRRLSRELPGYTVFFNGAKCGASAPDHMHFQAVPSQYLTVPDRFYTYTLPEASFSVEELDPMVNALCTDGVLTIIPRRKHRPDCYGELLVSPAAIDLAGTLISVRREDFERLDAGFVEQIISEVTFREPVLYVNLVSENPQMTALPDGTTEVNGIVIGKDFHWESRMSRRYQGELFMAGELLVNRIGLEDYLRSVISSEMSAMSSPELLKAHAVISRSWVLRQMRAFRTMSTWVDTASRQMEGEICQWFDHNDHDSFDVCSDDHCQRYQGVGNINGQVDAAIEATRGMVLTCNGTICDARFSKCCGGAFERFENCWQPTPIRYLREKRDILPEQPLPDLSDEQAARKWITGRPDAFCGQASDATLAQVLNDYDRATTPDFYRWTVRYSQREISELIARRSGVDFGNILDLRPLARGTSGRIYRMEIVGEKRSMVIGKELIIREWLSETHLYSSAFTVDREGSDFILRGAGWGHGVGLCQIGAAVMAEKGWGYKDILAHYFPSTALTRLY